MLIYITSPLSLPSVPSKSITRVHGSMFWAFANHIPLVVCDLNISRNASQITQEQAAPKGKKLSTDKYKEQAAYLPLKASISLKLVRKR
jgi:hypothetical protein